MGLADNRLLHIKILSQTWSKRSSPLFLASQCTSSVHGTNMASDSCAYCVCVCYFGLSLGVDFLLVSITIFQFSYSEPGLLGHQQITSCAWHRRLPLSYQNSVEVVTLSTMLDRSHCRDSGSGDLSIDGLGRGD